MQSKKSGRVKNRIAWREGMVNEKIVMAEPGGGQTSEANAVLLVINVAHGFKALSR
jgi:hypothetical protein